MTAFNTTSLPANAMPWHAPTAILRAFGRLLAAVVIATGVVACGGGGGSPAAPPVALPVITAFTATPAFVEPGQSSVLNWTATGATTVNLDQVAVTGQASTVVPAATKTYVLQASNTSGTASATVTVAVGRPVGLVVDTAKVAAESVLSDAQTLQAPPVSLYYVGDNDGRGAANTFQIQFILSDGAWVLGSNPERALRLEDGVTAVVGSQITGFPSLLGYEYRVSNVGLSADKRTLFFTIAGIQSAQALLLKPVVTLNASTNTLNGVAGVSVAADAVRVTGVKTLASGGTGTGPRTLQVAYRHYVALSNPALVASDANATPDQHTRSSAVLSVNLFEFVP